MTILNLFTSPLAGGAQTFLIIVCVLAGLTTGLINIDIKKTFTKKKKADH